MNTALHLFLTVSLLAAPSPDPARKALTTLVAKIQKADYEGDRNTLASLAPALDPYVSAGPLASRALYWRGFALWRRAMNGFNENADPKDLERDLTAAAKDFAAAAEKEAGFADARPAAASCVFSLAYLAREDAPRRQEYVTRGLAWMGEGTKLDPDNPRLLWIQGGGEWYVAAGKPEGQAKALRTYERALEIARRLRGSVKHPLDPSWGEPELLMSLAWSHLNGVNRDLEAAESNAKAALAIVPNWHYVRDILLPQIRTAKKP
ncbi:MAG TPA: hypothetical protein VE007_11850 [Thermoanaerobaculia bacterium]|nr:hypothetical protein [Thermoanaerobaculia bacterium]